MTEATLTFTEFEERLQGHSAKSLSKLALSENLQIPSSVSTKEGMIRAMWDARAAKSELNAKDSAEPSAGEGAAPSSVPPADGPRIRVLCRGSQQFWRYNFMFTCRWQDIPAATFTTSELAELRTHPRVIVRDA